MVAPPPRFAVRRRALLFRAGDYPDKNLAVGAGDLARLAAGFTPVPLLVEHAPSALALGELAAVEAVGDELFGTIALSEEAEALLRASGAGSLSLGLAQDLSAIREVSLVRHPRVEGARLFSDGSGAVRFDARLELPAPPRPLSAEEEELVRSRLVPSARPLARALLRHAEPILFDDGSTAVGALARRLLESLPKAAFAGFATPVPTIQDPDAEAALLTPEEAAFYRRHFPQVALGDIARLR